MANRLDRRTFVKGAGLGAAAVGMAIPAYIPRLGAAAETIKLGLLEPATGTYAYPGENETKGYHMAVDQWNARGGVLGRKVEFIQEDEQSNPGVGAQKAAKLINQDKVTALFGTVSSGVSLSVNGVAADAGVIFIDSGGHTDDVTGKNCHWSTFRVCHSTWMESHATGFSLAKKFGKRWYLITPDYAYGHALEQGFKDVLGKVGGTVVGNDLAPLGTTDFSSYLAKVPSAKPDVLVVLVQGDDYVNCLKQAHSFGILGKIPVGGPQVELESIWSLPPEARSGYWGIEWYYKSERTLGAGNTAAHQFVADFQRRYKVAPPTARCCFGYVAVDRYLHAVASAKSTDAVKVARALEGERFRSIFAGTAYFRKEDHQLMWPMWIAEIRANGTPGDKYDVFDVIDTQPADAIEQTISQKAQVCRMAYP